MSYENRKKEYERLVAEGKAILIPDCLMAEFGPKEKVPVVELVTKRTKKVIKNGK